MKKFVRILAIIVTFFLTQYTIAFADTVDAGTIIELKNRLNEIANPRTINITNNLSGDLDIHNWQADDLTINGNNHILDGLNSGNGFYYNDYSSTNKKISIDNITMKNFTASAGKASAIRRYIELSTVSGGSEIAIGNNVIFESNSSTTSGGAVYNDVYTNGYGHSTTITSMGSAQFEGNSSKQQGGAVYNYAGAGSGNATATMAVGDGARFEGNSGKNGGGAIYNQAENKIMIIMGPRLYAAAPGEATATTTIGKNVVFKNNNSLGGSGGAISNNATGQGAVSEVTIGDNTVFEGNSASQDGGAIHNQAIEGYQYYREDVAAKVEIGDGVRFEGNSATNGKGGAINNGVVAYGSVGETSSEINITTNGGTTKFTGNTDSTGLNDIYMGGNKASLNIKGDSGKVVFESGIANEKSDAVINHNSNNELVLGKEGVDAKFKTFTGTFNQTAGTTTVHGEMFDGTNNISNSTVQLWQSAPSVGIKNLNLDGATVNTANPLNTVNTFNIANFKAVGNNNFNVNANGIAKTSDKFVIASGTGDGTLNVSNFNFTSAPVDQEIILPVFEGDISNYGFSATQDKVITPIYKYSLTSLGEGKYRLFRDSDPINKNIYDSASATQAIKQNQTIVTNILFDHIYLDSFMNNKTVNNNRNKYASGGDFGPYQYSVEEGSVWLKNYVNIERLSLTQGLEVNSTTYGSILGVDFPAKRLKRGWKFIPTAFVGYNGARQGYGDVLTYQNGGQGGFMGTVIKEDFITSVLLYAGGYGNEINNANNKDTVGNWFAGATAKSAYNFRLRRDLILQPSVMINYNLFGKQAWGGQNGTPYVQQGYFNGINVAPNLNLIYNKDTWSLYLTAMYMYNINDGLSVTANGEHLPDIRMRHGYIEYGIGGMKTFKERLIAYCQIVMRNGGRTGVGFQLGANWLL